MGSLHVNDQAVCAVQDLSRNGIGLRTGQPPVLGQGVKLRIAIDEIIHELPARVTRVVQHEFSRLYDVGLDWTFCNNEQLAFLDEVLGVWEREPQA